MLHPKCRVRFVNFNIAQRTCAEKHLRLLRGLIPDWMRDLTITGSNDSSGDVVATTECKIEYRNAQITLHPSFFSDDKDEERRHFAHELSHLHVDVLIARLDALLNLEQYETIKAHLEETLVTDLANAFVDMQDMIQQDVMGAAKRLIELKEAEGEEEGEEDDEDEDEE
jgi:hypothetical protein